MFKRVIDDLSPAGGFPRQRISVYYGRDIIFPPSFYNLYSQVSRLPVEEHEFELQSKEPEYIVGCCSGTPATNRRVTLGELNVNRNRMITGTYRKYRAAQEDRIKRENLIRRMQSKGMAIGVELKAALERERMKERQWREQYEREAGLAAWPSKRC